MLINIILIGFFSGVFSAMGFGSGTLLIIWLTAVLSCPQLQAQGINLIFFIPCAALSLLLHKRKGNARLSGVLPIAAGGVFGVAAGQFIIPLIPTKLLSRLFGSFIILLCLKQLYDLYSTRSRSCEKKSR